MVVQPSPLGPGMTSFFGHVTVTPGPSHHTYKRAKGQTTRPVRMLQLLAQYSIFSFLFMSYSYKVCVYSLYIAK